MNIKRIVVGALETNCYLLFSEGELVVVDPGGDASEIIKEIKETGEKPKFILNTHLHPDHIAANKKIEVATGAQIKKDLQEGEVLQIGNEKLKVLHTPGHTEDSFSFLFANFIVSGDVLFPGGHGRVDLPGGSEEKMKETLRRLEKELPEEIIAYPGHGESFTMKEWKDSFLL